MEGLEGVQERHLLVSHGTSRSPDRMKGSEECFHTRERHQDKASDRPLIHYQASERSYFTTIRLGMFGRLTRTCA
jgi:hypothetical protein